MRIQNIMTSFGLALMLSACGGSGASAPVAGPPPATGGPATPPPVNSSMIIDTPVKAYTFLNHATFGASSAEIDSMIGASATDWIEAQIAMEPRFYTDMIVARRNAGENNWAINAGAWWDKFINQDDQLRQRMAWALSQIIVKSYTLNEDNVRNGPIIDAYTRHALGNYGDLLEEITWTQGMADWLTYMNSRKADPETGSMPDENYAREIMQLFSIGLVELNMDGTPKLGADGQPVEAYDNNDVIGLARVFTGLVGTRERSEPLSVNERHHEMGEKTFLGHTIAAGTPVEDSISEAVQVLVDHPNTPPFIARQLIQRFTQSAPSPDYVERVATAFAEGRYTASDSTVFGTGERGDLAATIAAVLLDSQYFDDVAPASYEGKLREPVLRLAHILRAFEFSRKDTIAARGTFNALHLDNSMGQSPQTARSVFGFYRPGFISRGSASGEAGLTAPELQLMTSERIRTYADAITNFVFRGSENRRDPQDAFYPVFSAELALNDNPEALVDHVDRILTNGNLSDLTRQRILDGLSEMTIRDADDPERRDELGRVRFAIWMVATSTEFALTQ